MSKTTVSEPIGRTVRTAGQLAPAAVITELVDVFFVNLDERGYAAVLAGLTLVFTYVQNAVENSKGKGWWFRQVPPTDVPVVDETSKNEVQVAGENPYVDPNFNGIQDDE